jgi:hypothetical protein
VLYNLVIITSVLRLTNRSESIVCCHLPLGCIYSKTSRVPLLVNVTPLGIVKVSPLSPRVILVPVLGVILFTSNVLIIYSYYTITKVLPEGMVKVPLTVIGPAAEAFLLAPMVMLLNVWAFCAMKVELNDA